MSAADRAKGSRLESVVAARLAELVDDRIERRARTGAKDRGDIGGVRHRGQRVVIECKNHSRLELSTWKRQAETEAGNDDAAIGVIVHKRYGVSLNRPGEQWVTMTVDDLAWLLGADLDAE